MSDLRQEQSDLFGWSDQNASSEWVGMPEYANVYEDDPEFTATFKFRCEDDYQRFHELVKEHLYDGKQLFYGTQRPTVKQAWYPLGESPALYEYADELEAKNPRFPIYIITKGRWKNNPTSKHLSSMHVPFYMIVEEDEREHYRGICPDSRLLVLPQKYRDEYDTFWEDEDGRTGSGPARNFAWEHSIARGHAWHWVMDDNIEGFYRFNRNMKIRCNSGTCFHVAEDFVLRYENVAMAGLNYTIFCPQREARPPVRFNIRIYSCLLVRNDLPLRWRGLYNEDVDLSLRMLKGGWCTVMFNAFLCAKMSTQKMGGGNTEELYGEGTLEKSRMLVAMHPDVARVGMRFNRWHHYVDYRPYAGNRLVRKEGLELPQEPDNFGLVLRRCSPLERKMEDHEDSHNELGTLPAL